MIRSLQHFTQNELFLVHINNVRINKHSINFNLFDIEGEQEAKKKKESVQKDV